MMANWIERARREIPKSGRQPTANADERALTAVTAVPQSHKTECFEITDGRLVAVKICSHVLDACLWLAFDDDFQPGDDDEQLAVYYSPELPFLKDKTVDQLREIHRVK